MMFKTLFFIFVTLGIQVAESKVEGRWLTVSSILLDDGKTKILFDAPWTRPGLLDWLGIGTFKSDEKLVSDILTKNNMLNTQAVFASHSHFDHIVDVPMVSKLTGAVFYTDESSERIAAAYKEPKIRTVSMKANQEIRVGDFLITPLLRDHAKILNLFEFIPGPVPADTDLSFWDYHVGSTWYFVVKHPDGTILIDQGTESHIDEVRKISETVDVLFQGVANRKDDETIVTGYSKTFNPKIFVPVHFDNFMGSFNDGKTSDLVGMKLDGLLGKLKKAYPTMKVDRPEFGKAITLLEIK
jgi:L-ascorbate metabolism protein UlaG (beta-lactamase superfamily)